jgi:hypothetical protein
MAQLFDSCAWPPPLSMVYGHGLPVAINSPGVDQVLLSPAHGFLPPPPPTDGDDAADGAAAPKRQRSSRPVRPATRLGEAADGPGPGPSDADRGTGDDHGMNSPAQGQRYRGVWCVPCPARLCQVLGAVIAMHSTPDSTRLPARVACSAALSLTRRAGLVTPDAPMNPQAGPEAWQVRAPPPLLPRPPLGLLLPVLGLDRAQRRLWLVKHRLQVPSHATAAPPARCPLMS